MELLATHRILSQVSDSQSNLLKLTPPLVISQEECFRVVSALRNTFERLSGPSAPFVHGIKRVALNLVR
jgi:acetylornithine/succinyldiaminopimelate/putrescine aminotransferase